MKLFSDYPLASVAMSTNARLIEQLEAVFAAHPITHVLETGTNIGLGSTKILADIAARHNRFEELVSLEVNPDYARQAAENLKAYPFVEVRCGLSTGLQEALDFMQNDPALLQHSDFPDIFIDDVSNPMRFYTREVNGLLGRSRGTGKPLEENLLRSALNAIRDKDPFILLDSAGGIGWLEFTITREIMAASPYFLLLDDTHHLKHFRSLEAITNSPAFTLIDQDSEHGWALARHTPPTQPRS